MTNSTIHNALTGDALLAKINQMEAQVGEDESVPKSDLVRACGYVALRDDGTENLKFTDFYVALLAAKGVNLDEKVEAGARATEGEVEYEVQMPVTVYVSMTVKGAAGLDKEAVTQLITRDDLANSQGEMTWDDLKDAWRSDAYDSWFVQEVESGEEVN